MFRAFEGDQRLVEPVCLPVSSSLTPTIRVAGKTEHDFMPADVLCSLIGIAAPGSRRPYQSQPQRLVIRFVGTVLAVGKDRRSIRTAFVSQIDPLMRSDFELALFGI